MRIDEIHLDILPDETARVGDYICRGIGLVRMRDVYEPWELYEDVDPDATCWGARVIGIIPTR